MSSAYALPVYHLCPLLVPPHSLRWSAFYVIRCPCSKCSAHARGVDSTPTGKLKGRERSRLMPATRYKRAIQLLSVLNGDRPVVLRVGEQDGDVGHVLLSVGSCLAAHL